MGLLAVYIVGAILVGVVLSVLHGANIIPPEVCLGSGDGPTLISPSAPFIAMFWPVVIPVGLLGLLALGIFKAGSAIGARIAAP